MKILKFPICLCILLFAFGAQAQSDWKNGRLRVSDDAHFLKTSKDRPFFWLGDTGWELFHRLTFEEIQQYLNDRRRKGFNVIQAVVLPEFDGIKKPNRYGAVPFSNFKVETPSQRYFQLVDTVVRLCANRDMYLCLLPTWGDKVTPNWGTGPVMFNTVTAYAYGKWLGNRYKDAENVIWMLGGDRPPVKDTNDWRPIWRAMARGIQEGTNYQCFITYHTSGGPDGTSKYLHREEWLNMNTVQSGHGSGHDVPVWKWIERDYKLPNPKPVIDAEPNYEDHPVNPWPTWDERNGYFDNYDVRKQCYRSVFAGAAGVTYGDHAVWQFYNGDQEPVTHVDRSWTKGLTSPGSEEVGYLRKLIECRPYLGRVPDNSMILSGNGQKGLAIVAFRGKDNQFGMIYMPIGKTIRVKTTWMKSDDIKAWWWDPRIGMMVRGESLPRRNEMEFTPPTQGVGHDWVLILDNPEAGFRPPGQ
ncbi:MAG: glycoside hydrolase family 140 protein [Flavihumibacter sp.]